jgi:hypothetical protein
MLGVVMLIILASPPKHRSFGSRRWLVCLLVFCCDFVRVGPAHLFLWRWYSVFLPCYLGVYVLVPGVSVVFLLLCCTLSLMS